MGEFLVNYTKYIGITFSVAMILEYLVPRKIADEFGIKLIDFSGVIKGEKIDDIVSKFAKLVELRLNSFYGFKFFNIRQWIISSFLVFSYCCLFALIEQNYIGFESTIIKQLKFWFIPSLIADICSVNFTRYLLSKTIKNPDNYLDYLFLDFILVIFFFYISYSFAILSLFQNHKELELFRKIFHPFCMASYAIRWEPSPTTSSIRLTVVMALTTSLPTIIHFVFISFGIFIRYTLPLFTKTSDFFIDRVISYDRHPIAVFVIILGIFASPIYFLTQI